MKELKRIYVEKIKDCDIEAQILYKDLKENLLIESLEGVRILNRYDCYGLSLECYEMVNKIIFAEPTVDVIYENNVISDEKDTVFAIEYLPGQYDQRADSAVQCIQIVTLDEKTEINCAKVFVLKGELSIDDISRIKKYCINPVDSREAALNIQQNIEQEEISTPKKIDTHTGFINMNDDEADQKRNELGLAMNTNDIIFCRNYFRDIEKRDPTVTEIRLIDTYWSDHCRHTTFLTSIKNIEFDNGKYSPAIKTAFDYYIEERNKVYGLDENKRDICLMDIAVMGMKALRKKGLLDDLDVSDEINACSIEIDVDVEGTTEKWLLMFKNETHNHPTEIEPFGGAATCLGGAIRDPLSGRAFVYQAMRITGSSDPNRSVSDTIPGKLPACKITTGAAQGYSSYGNQIGLATGMVHEFYNEGYMAKRMEIGAVIGAAPKSHVYRDKPISGDVIILVGGRTGRDGCGGATGSSKEHNENSILTCGAEVQKGNPPTERKLQRLFRNNEASKLIKRCNDFGAGGVAVAIGELAPGLVVDLDQIPKKYEGLDGTELAISESQERMAVVISKENANKFIQLALEENIEATIVAQVTDDMRLKMTWQSETIVDISREFLDSNGAKQITDVSIVSPSEKTPFEYNEMETNGNFKESLISNLSLLNIASQKGLIERFDSTIGAATVLMPLGGKYQLTEPTAMVAKLPVEKGETTTVSIMSYGFCPDISQWSPYHGAITAVVDSICKIIAAGGEFSKIRLSFQEYFEKLGNDPVKWGKPFAALLGAFYAQMMTSIPSIGGKDSMSGSFNDLSVPPTLVSFAVCTGNIANITSPEFKNTNSTVILLKCPYDEKDDQPDFNSLKENCELITKLIKEQKISAVQTTGYGGIAVAISKMCFGNKIGFAFNDNISELFNMEYGSFIVELKESSLEQSLLEKYTDRVITLGKTLNEEVIKFKEHSISLEEAIAAWSKTLEKVFPTKTTITNESNPIIKSFNIIKKETSKNKIVAPRVFIPIFPGTNCEYDTINAFTDAGAKTSSFVFKNYSSKSIEDSIDVIVNNINNSQIVMIPGGFSAGDEPDGSGKFIAAVFRNPSITEAVNNLLFKRDGLMLGICNGFQALIKLGLVPYGEITDLNENSPTLSFNSIGRHVSCMVKTKIISNLSPWLWNVKTGDVHSIPISHGEGRFIATKEVINELEKNGQIATQYVDFNSTPSYNINHNPNGSYYSIEGITSKDGRIFGKMGHSERIGKGLYKNIEGNFDQKIFQSGVNYFN